MRHLFKIVIVMLVLLIIAGCMQQSCPEISLNVTSFYNYFTIEFGTEVSECSQLRLRLSTKPLTIDKSELEENTTFPATTLITATDLNPGDTYYLSLHCLNNDQECCFYTGIVSTKRDNDNTPPQINEIAVNYSSVEVKVRDVPSGVRNVTLKLKDDIPVPNVITVDLTYFLSERSWKATYTLPHKGTWLWQLEAIDKSGNLAVATGTINY